MNLRPPVVGVVERRVLVNFRVDPDDAARMLPSPFRPRLQRGHAVTGLCLLRMGDLRPAPLPSRFGIGSESVAHRIAVEWDSEDGVRTGVFVHRRDTDSWLTVLVGGRAYPGVHRHARFDVEETEERLHIACRSDDGATDIAVDVEVADRLAGSELFTDTVEASRFFEGGSVGWSPAHDTRRVEGLVLETTGWHVDPAVVHEVRSSLWPDAELDCALVMRRVPAVWRPVQAQIA